MQGPQDVPLTAQVQSPFGESWELELSTWAPASIWAEMATVEPNVFLKRNLELRGSEPAVELVVVNGGFSVSCRKNNASKAKRTAVGGFPIYDGGGGFEYNWSW